MSSYSLSYPGNDIRRAQHFDDLPLSWKETIARSIEQRKFTSHRKFPKTESLKDCMDRSIPFYTKRIREEAVKKGKRVLITSHENAFPWYSDAPLRYTRRRNESVAFAEWFGTSSCVFESCCVACV